MASAQLYKDAGCSAGQGAQRLVDLVVQQFHINLGHFKVSW